MYPALAHFHDLMTSSFLSLGGGRQESDGENIGRVNLVIKRLKILVFYKLVQISP